MQYRARGTYGVGASFESAGWREASTNSGESILDRCVRKSGRHGATPTLEEVVAVVDIVRAIRRRRALAVEAMVEIWSQLTPFCRLRGVEVVVFTLTSMTTYIRVLQGLN
jgi:hypothetical protein